MLGRGSCSRPNGRPKQRLVSIPWPRRSPHMTISRGRGGGGGGRGRVRFFFDNGHQRSSSRGISGGGEICFFLRVDGVWVEGRNSGFKNQRKNEDFSFLSGSNCPGTRVVLHRLFCTRRLLLFGQGTKEERREKNRAWVKFKQSTLLFGGQQGEEKKKKKRRGGNRAKAGRPISNLSRPPKWPPFGLISEEERKILSRHRQKILSLPQDTWQICLGRGRITKPSQGPGPIIAIRLLGTFSPKRACCFLFSFSPLRHRPPPPLDSFSR